ncbi:peptidoglycan-binding protein [Kocuria tytonis]|uniref:N-acetylmuramoyl-L-alanine amidase n=1 Tax=Kocuria tytonis TaxID=2054280 RepID=A0A495A610_9MICC|nr:peptidoglycan-binding protein [Kocuria tytonis]RKQ35189.1 N-acetylmuramoyl-L-alanine amidase [Kocuria tytonis]
MTDRRVVGLRERLVRAGAEDSALDPHTAADAALFDDAVDHAVRGFQQHKGLIVDGVVGPDTEAALNDAQYSLGDRPLSYQQDQPLHGDDVEELQNNLSLLGFYYGHPNATFNQQTEYAIKELQRSLGLPDDGVVDLDTLTGLARVSKKITTSKAFSLRDYHRLEMLHEALRDRAVILVPSRGNSQLEPASAPGSFATEQDAVTMDVAEHAYDLLRNVGAAPVLIDPAADPQNTQPVSEPPGNQSGTPSVAPAPEHSGALRGSMADSATALRAHPGAVVLYLQCDWNRSPEAQGVATYFWGTPMTGQPYAPIGQLTSAMILRELVARTGAQDLGSHARQWSALRSSGAAAAWVDLGYLSNPAEAVRLRSPAYRARLAESLICGLQRVLAPAPESTATGAMSLADIQMYYRQHP